MIPRKIHFIWYDINGGEKAKLPSSYQRCIMSAKVFNPDYEIIIHTNKLLEWDQLRSEDFTNRMIDETLVEEAYKIGILETKRMIHWNVSHLSDWLRFNILYEEGGIYLDTDVVTIKSYDSLLRNKLVVAKETKQHICCGVFMSEPGHNVIKKVIDSYRNDYHHKEWVYNCQVLTYQYILEDIDNCTVLELKEGFHYPNWWTRNLELFDTVGVRIEEMFPKSYAHHLWGHYSKRTEGLIEDFDRGEKNTYIAKLGDEIRRRYNAK